MTYFIFQWDNYTSCSEFPDPSEERAVNTYLTLCEENTSCPQINDALIDIDNWLQVSVFTKVQML